MSLDLCPARLRARLSHGEQGSAVIEFIFLGVLIAMPVFYLVIALAQLQAGAYAVAQASREGTRAFVTAPQAASAGVRAQAASRLAFADQGFGQAGTINITCSSVCTSPGSQVTGSADLDVRLPLIPSFLRSVVPSSIHLHATQIEQIDRFRARP